MKLEKFKERNHKRIGIIVFTITCVLFVGAVFLYRSFAVFEVKTNQNIIEGKIEDPGNIYFAFYQMNDNGNYEIQKDMPSKEEGYRLDTKTSYCGVNGEKDSSITVSMTNDWIVQVKGMTTSRTKCNLYFKKGENFVEYLRKLPTQEENSGMSGLYLINHSSADITWEGTTEQVNNLKQEERRYAGVNCTDGSTDYVHNYVNIDDQVWRVIGLVNTPEGQRIKLVKDKSIGAYSWDVSPSNVNSGHGINEWSNSDIMKLLNNGYDRNELESLEEVQEYTYVNNSLYWNAGQGQCYASKNNSAIDCDFIDNKIPDSLKLMLEEVTWNTGGNRDNEYNTLNTVQFYERERSLNSGKICNDDSYCNDKIDRKFSWKGKVGLIYPSDYGYAVGGSGRTSCLNTAISSWNQSENCYKNDWLYDSDYWQWTLTPYARQIFANFVFTIDVNGHVNNNHAYDLASIRPTVYLSTSVLLVTGDGSFDNMFRLSL